MCSQSYCHNHWFTPSQRKIRMWKRRNIDIDLLIFCLKQEYCQDYMWEYKGHLFNIKLASITTVKINVLKVFFHLNPCDLQKHFSMDLKLSLMQNQSWDHVFIISHPSLLKNRLSLSLLCRDGWSFGAVAPIAELGEDNASSKLTFKKLMELGSLTIWLKAN